MNCLKTVQIWLLFKKSFVNWCWFNDLWFMTYLVLVSLLWSLLSFEFVSVLLLSCARLSRICNRIIVTVIVIVSQTTRRTTLDTTCHVVRAATRRVPSCQRYLLATLHRRPNHPPDSTTGTTTSPCQLVQCTPPHTIRWSTQLNTSRSSARHRRHR